MEKEQRMSSHAELRGPHMISVIYYDLAEGDAWEEPPNGQANIISIKFV